MVVRVLLRNGYLCEFNPLAQKTFRIQGEFTEVAFVAIQIYQVTYCSQEITNWIYHCGYAESILKIVFSHQLAHLSDIFKELVGLRERLNIFSCRFWEADVDLPLLVSLGKRRRFGCDRRRWLDLGFIASLLAVCFITRYLQPIVVVFPSPLPLYF